MILYSNIPELREVSTGLYTVEFQNDQAEVSEELADYLMNLYPGKFSVSEFPQQGDN